MVGETAKLVAEVPDGPPLSHAKDAPARLLPAKSVVEPPLHITVVPVMVGTGTGVTVTVCRAEAVQPKVVETTKLVLKLPVCGNIIGGGEAVVLSTEPLLVKSHS